MKRLLAGAIVVVSVLALPAAFGQGARMLERKARLSVPAADLPAAGGPAAKPARGDEAGAALERVFGGALVGQLASAAIGDFNGDGSPDLAVSATPTARGIGALGDSLASWMLLDLDAPRLHARTPVPVAAGDALIAIIHGSGPAGWRSPEARQAYVLKRGPAAPQVRALGDSQVLAGSRDGRRGFVRWTGARYAWREEAAR
jgi:hypothetical protein